MKDRSDDPSHHERTLLPRSYISFPQNNQFPLLLFIQLSAYLFTHINALFYPKNINELFIKIKLQNLKFYFDCGLHINILTAYTITALTIIYNIKKNILSVAFNL